MAPLNIFHVALVPRIIEFSPHACWRDYSKGEGDRNLAYIDVRECKDYDVFFTQEKRSDGVTTCEAAG